MVAFNGCLPALEVTLPACCDNVVGALSGFGVLDTKSHYRKVTLQVRMLLQRRFRIQGLIGGAAEIEIKTRSPA